MSEESSDISSAVDVGYVDEVESWKLESRFFPSKVGGRPAWLNFSELPSPETMACVRCQEPRVFLCQVYAPIETRDDCFHRTLYIFVCRNPKCHASNDNGTFIVFRSQLVRENDFYPFEPPEDTDKWHPECQAERWTDVCASCGNKGTSHCGRCKKVKYCGRSHQVIHWRDYHKQTCNKGVEDLYGKSSCLLPEYELIVEPEGKGQETGKRAFVMDGSENDDDDDEDDDDDDDEEAEKARIDEFNRLANQGKIGTLADDESVNSDLLKMAASEEDKIFNAFKARVDQNPGQVLRYQRNGVPLWLSNDHVPTEADVPPCKHCGAKRVYEFQVLPQLLNHLSLDDVEQSIDWGTLAVYTCENSCSEGPAYKAEFLWKQDITN